MSKARGKPVRAHDESFVWDVEPVESPANRENLFLSLCYVAAQRSGDGVVREITQGRFVSTNNEMKIVIIVRGC